MRMSRSSERQAAAPTSWQAHVVCDNSPLETSQFTVPRRDVRALGVLAAIYSDAPPTQIPVESWYQEADQMIPDHVNPLEWHQSVGVARQSCARVFRDGGTPADALAAFGLKPADHVGADWSRAVEIIALAMCGPPMRRAA